MKYLLAALFSYVLGSISPAYLMGRLKGFDIRSKGSKNAGASNVVITLGEGMGILCAAFDVAKAVLAVWLTGMIFPESNTFAVSAVSCILGHIFPFYLGFRGGKGLACLGGVVFIFDLRVFIVLMLIECIIILATRYICFVPITASACFPFIYGFIRNDPWGAVLFAGIGAVIFCKHVENLRRIAEGKELRISYLWNRDKEAKRIQKQDSLRE